VEFRNLSIGLKDTPMTGLGQQRPKGDLSGMSASCQSQTETKEAANWAILVAAFRHQACRRAGLS
jgi:hypothetical protein